jgi:hypothetical protein
MWGWAHLWNLSDFVRLNGYKVLLPVTAEHHPNITVDWTWPHEACHLWEEIFSYVVAVQSALFRS